MYHFILKRILRSAFEKLNRGDYASILGQFAPDFQHIFYGDHALSGTRTTSKSNGEWYRRLYEIFPDLHFDLLNMDVSGFPWNTTASVQWKDRFSGPDGTVYNNQGVHVFRLKWGRVTSLQIYTDTHKLAAILDSFARNGRPAAGEAPITDV
ncbi:MAG: nuclear transport factor 2 family protein [Anaerolineales bacterium]|nr:nuclear transport factor 2 family protein [Anaerolineales bacterium]